MPRFGAIDLSAYAPPDALVPLDYEGELTLRKAAFLKSFEDRGATEAELAEMAAILGYEFEPIVALLEADAYRDLTMIGRINDKVRAVLLATATGTTLDHIGATYYRAPRRTIIAASAAPDGVAVMEDDETYRQRLALAPESWSSAGPEGAYLYFGMSASGDVLDLAVYSEDEGVCKAPRVRIPVLATGNVAASASLISTVLTALNRKEIRPFADRVIVEAATPLNYSVNITLQCRAGASAELVRAASLARVNAYCSGRIRWAGDAVAGPVWLIGRRIRLTTLAAAARVDGVEEVIINSPVADVNAPNAGYTQAALANVGLDTFTPLAANLTAHLFNAPICTGVTINVETVSGSWTS